MAREELSPSEGFERYFKRRLMRSRILGIVSCLLAFTCLILFYSKIMNEWMCLVVMTYCMANAFAFNGSLQDIKKGNAWMRLNAIFAIIFYLGVVFLISYGFAGGHMTIQF